ncbi:RNA ligase [Mesorhizobium sp. DCY119]|uniref:RNA ligase n=1 Tax=Mesorhizobium sp. DCY119 TaxID=2108445 RepID=UPI000E6BCFCC|nr:RNA ligase [Mesorhizobium sp. DCY119]RJG46526.1 hypothetical protein D3Y55_21265 [Mesorhizobium sp. DCY119]
MTHFRINHIDDVLPHLDGRQEFVVADKGDYTVIDYVYALPDSFDHPARLECRGIKFAPDGRILARPFHKFFNVGERPETQPHVLDFSRPHTIMEKLDGSMIHPAIVNGEVVFMTRMGRTDHAVRAERHITSKLRNACHAMLEAGATPIFEWTAPDNRIVVRYDRSDLTLLAIRKNASGEYLPTSLQWAFSRESCIDLVEHHTPQHTTATEFLAYARAIQGAEGFVVRFEDGTMVKAKGEDYVLKHRAKDSILQEKNILALVLSGGLDDVLPLLDEADADAAREYAASVEAGVKRRADDLADFVAANSNLPQKDFALQAIPRLPVDLRSPAFMVRAGQEAREVIRARIAANTTSQTKVDESRALHGARWVA